MAFDCQPSRSKTMQFLAGYAGNPSQAHICKIVVLQSARLVGEVVMVVFFVVALLSISQQLYKCAKEERVGRREKPLGAVWKPRALVTGQQISNHLSQGPRDRHRLIMCNYQENCEGP